jgi:hypothetical protein
MFSAASGAGLHIEWGASLARDRPAPESSLAVFSKWMSFLSFRKIQ